MNGKQIYKHFMRHLMIDNLFFRSANAHSEVKIQESRNISDQVTERKIEKQ